MYILKRTTVHCKSCDPNENREKQEIKWQTSQSCRTNEHRPAYPIVFLFTCHLTIAPNYACACKCNWLSGWTLANLFQPLEMVLVLRPL